jgi:hypothetical protein
MHIKDKNIHHNGSFPTHASFALFRRNNDQYPQKGRRMRVNKQAEKELKVKKQSIV